MSRAELFQGEGMRCFFMSAGHITAVEILTADSDEEAIGKAHDLFRERLQKPGAIAFEGFEVWDRTRFLYRHSAAPAPTSGQSPPES